MGKRILVIGGTGMLGELVARRLNSDGFKVRIMNRDTERARELFDESFELVPGDVSDVRSIEKALEDCSAVHLNLPIPTEGIGANNTIAATTGHSLERIGWISGTLAVEENEWYPPIRKRLMVDRALKESGIPYTIFCNAFVMDGFNMFVENGKAMMAGKQTHPTHMIAGEDFARMISTAYQQEECANKRFFLHGPEAIHIHDALVKYLAEFHPEIKKITRVPMLMVRIMGMLTRNTEMKVMYDFMSFFNKYGDFGDPVEANEILGAPRITFDQWLTEQKAAMQ